MVSFICVASKSANNTTRRSPVIDKRHQLTPTRSPVNGFENLAHPRLYGRRFGPRWLRQLMQSRKLRRKRPPKLAALQRDRRRVKAERKIVSMSVVTEGVKALASSELFLATSGRPPFGDARLAVFDVTWTEYPTAWLVQWREIVYCHPFADMLSSLLGLPGMRGEPVGWLLYKDTTAGDFYDG